GLKPVNTWKGYTIANHPGLILLTDVMTSNLQKHLVKRCLNDLVKQPNKTNLDSYTKEEDIDNIFINFSNLLKKLRWITMGYHHNWDTKLYAEENKSEMPQDISELAECIAKVVGFTEFTAEAGIVNVYHKNSSLAGHVDNSEYDFSSPIISLSLGCTCIFLIGGPDKTSEPTALYLRSGDVVVMSGEARLCYHAVPCIITSSYTCLNDKSTTDCHEKCFDSNENNSKINSESYTMDNDFDNDWHLYENFLKESRININTRQV
ncbi:hypothetical protein HELRODRAFT_123161, partial [Helobdella robusta]|uniref:Fe2OG dioxygenase domain-containing protein n=1 Tax=Helobdella robusta TaxID=6412 RepID=T1EGX1_HELRO